MREALLDLARAGLDLLRRHFARGLLERLLPRRLGRLIAARGRGFGRVALYDRLDFGLGLRGRETARVDLAAERQDQRLRRLVEAQLAVVAPAVLLVIDGDVGLAGDARRHFLLDQPERLACADLDHGVAELRVSVDRRILLLLAETDLLAFQLSHLASPSGAYADRAGRPGSKRGILLRPLPCD